MVLTFQPGVLNHSISVTILNDLIVEGNETFFVELDNQGQAATIQPDSEVATVVILDDFVDSKSRSHLDLRKLTQFITTN